MRQFKQLDQYIYERTGIHETEIFHAEAEAALRLVERWGCVAGIEDGEDSQGRRQFRLQTPEELVERAFTCTRLLFEGARARNLVLTIPDIEKLYPSEPASDEKRLTS